jgi:hemerythrin
MPLSWDPSFGVGIDILDRQHRRLVDCIASLQTAMSEGQGSASLDTLFGHLFDYVQVHCATEEQLMRDAAYPLLDTHCVQHRRLLACLETLRRRHLEGSRLASVEVLDFLLAWLARHVQGHDAAMARYVVSVRHRPRLALLLNNEKPPGENT